MGTPKRSPVALAIMALLREEPMHPYRMQQLLRERGKYEVINVRQRASLYQTIDRLLRDGLIAVRATTREENRPERTVYALTELGSETADEWLREALSTPAKEYPEFPAALSLLPMLTPEDARRQLEIRVLHLRAEVARMDSLLCAEREGLPRLFLVEMEYVRAVFATELEWVRGLVDDLRTGRLTWNEEWVRAMAAQFTPPAPPASERGS
jgi:DNA-binding PadR family transcriptional regulator